MRIALALGSIALAFTVHLVSEGAFRTPISLEIADGNPVAIGLFFVIGFLILRVSIDFWDGGSPGLSMSPLPIVLALPGIAFTSPQGTFHLHLFALTATYGLIWIAVTSFMIRKAFLGFLAIGLAVFSVVFLLGFGVMEQLGGYTPAESPLGVFQKLLIVLFALLCLEMRPVKPGRWSR